ncbi:MAG: DUF2721 domain-containing protein [Anaerolineae bacterium]
MPSTVTVTIQTILAPAVMISACGLLLLGLQNRYGRINDRLRALARERVQLLPERTDPLAAARLIAIEKQLPDLLRRLRRQRDAVLCFFWAVVAFVLDSLLIALQFVASGAAVRALVLLVFMAGMILVLAGALLAAGEIGISARAVVAEVEEIGKL